MLRFFFNKDWVVYSFKFQFHQDSHFHKGEFREGQFHQGQFHNDKFHKGYTQGCIKI